MVYVFDQAARFGVILQKYGAVARLIESAITCKQCLEKQSHRLSGGHEYSLRNELVSGFDVESIALKPAVGLVRQWDSASALPVHQTVAVCPLPLVGHF